MFKLINDEHEKIIADFVNSLKEESDIKATIDKIDIIIKKIHNDIPDNKRISYGLYSVCKDFGNILFKFINNRIDVLKLSTNLFENSNNSNVKIIAMNLLAHYGVHDINSLDIVYDYFIKAALEKDWVIHECSCGFMSLIIQKYPDETKEFMLKLIKSDSAILRRFAGESLRPIERNKWFHKNPDYQLSIIKNLFKESDPYPRTSAGNNLSDWSRLYPDMVYQIVQELVESGDKNSYWIAYRACRNLVKKEPLKVLDLLKINEYKYKDRYFKRDDLQ
ncbi:MAG TPA: DNA alkylation repair protein [Spirochaetota bacterium]|nr:DNA alkylation repair protein [Spirochaetota bacterium]